MSALTAGVLTDSEELYRVSNGNPFFITEILRSDNPDASSLPVSIKDMIISRLARLSSDEREFLETISVSPAPLSINTLRKLFGAPAIHLLAKCLDSRLLVEDENGVIKFRHELARRAIFDSAPAQNRQRAHERFFEVVSLDNNMAALGLQLYHADGARMADNVLNVAPLAAEKAASLGAHSEAFSYLNIALKYVDGAPPQVAAPIWEHWAGAACVSTSMDDSVVEGREKAAQLWLELSRKDKAAENLRWQSRLEWFRCNPKKAETLALEAVSFFELTESVANKALAASLRAQLMFLRLDMDEAIHCSEFAIDLANQCNALEAKVHALNTLGAAKCFLNNPCGIELIQESLHLAESTLYGEHSVHDADIARAYLNLADHAVEFRKFDLAQTAINEGVKRCGEIEFEAWVWQLHARHAHALA